MKRVERLRGIPRVAAADLRKQSPESKPEGAVPEKLPYLSGSAYAVQRSLEGRSRQAIVEDRPKERLA